MGAWGFDSFENDDALDWVATLTESHDFSEIDTVFEAILENDNDYLEAPDCSVALAAAEVVAALNGKGSKSLPEEIIEWIKNKPKPSSGLIKNAQLVIDKIQTESELLELWKENEDVFPKWLDSLKDLKTRLK
jgi:hypothetical protein